MPPKVVLLVAVVMDRRIGFLTPKEWRKKARLRFPHYNLYVRLNYLQPAHLLGPKRRQFPKESTSLFGSPQGGTFAALHDACSR